MARAAVAHSRSPMVVTDPHLPDNPVIMANPAFLALTGRRQEDVIGRNCRFMQGPDTDPQAVSSLRQAIADEREITVELLNYRQDGSTFRNQLFVSPVHDEAGRLIYFFASQIVMPEAAARLRLEAEEHRLMREVDHRAKNALALVQGIVRLSRADDAAAYASAVQGRVEALARAHALLADERWHDVLLTSLIDVEAAPFDVNRIEAEGPPLRIAATLVQPLALLLHEMLANAAQHGALSAPRGGVLITWRREEGELLIEWRERNGPPPTSSPTRMKGFGSSIMEATIRRQLRGRLDFDWLPEGLFARFAVPARIGHGPAGQYADMIAGDDSGGTQG